MEQRSSDKVVELPAVYKLKWSGWEVRNSWEMSISSEAAEDGSKEIPLWSPSWEGVQGVTVGGNVTLPEKKD